MAIGTPYLIASNVNHSAVNTMVLTAGSVAAGSTGTGHGTVAGDTITVFGSATGVADIVTGVTDSRGNTYAAVTGASETTNFSASAWEALNTTALVSGVDTITLTYTSALSQAINAIAVGCSGCKTSGAVDIGVSASAVSTSPSVSSGTLAQASEVLFAYVIDTTTGGAITWSGGWTALAGSVQSGANHISAAAYQVVSATTAVTAGGTITSATWAILAMSLKAVAGVSPGAGLPAGSAAAGAPVPGVAVPMAIGGN